MELTGIFQKNLNYNSGETARGRWRSIDFLIETDEQYKKTVIFNAMNDLVQVVENLKYGQKVSVKFSLDTNEWQGKYFLKARAFAIVAEAKPQETPAPAPQPTLIPNTDKQDNEPIDDLPF